MGSAVRTRTRVHAETEIEVVVRGRNVEVPDHFRQHAGEKLSKMERYDHKIIRLDVELHHEKNRRQRDNCQHVEITCRSRGPVVRAEACAGDFYSALDGAVEKLERRFRQAADRRRVHRGRRGPTGLARAAADPAVVAAIAGAVSPNGADASAVNGSAHGVDAEDVDDGPGRIVRVKDHPGAPKSVDQALFEMELVGHDFYLFADAETGRPCVVYRRHGFDYGLIRLETAPGSSPGSAQSAADSS